tara:strand:+ start:1010 stop:1843 length:834 start_codon:yes stop_codon:yes gene_type:complete
MNYRRIIIIGLIITILIFIICLNGTVNESFNNSNQDILYEFKLGYGGIGDFIKFMRICKIESEIRNVKFYINFDHPLNKYLKINNKFTGNYDKNNVNIIKPFDYYNRFDKNSALQMDTINKTDFKPLDYFYINDDCKNRYNFLKNKNNIPDIYEGIHIILGDSKMSSTKKNKDDDRVGELDIYSKLDNLVNGKRDTTFVLFTDNEKVKNEINSKYNNVKILDICIVHTSDENEDVKILDNLCDFLFLSNAKVIHSFTKSGFPIVASWIYNNNLSIYY